jgi:hypothetical protein
LARFEPIAALDATVPSVKRPPRVRCVETANVGVHATANIGRVATV